MKSNVFFPDLEFCIILFHPDVFYPIISEQSTTKASFTCRNCAQNIKEQLNMYMQFGKENSNTYKISYFIFL